jgi:hypothetical protein
MPWNSQSVVFLVAGGSELGVDGMTEVDSHDRHVLAAVPRFGLKGLDVISDESKPQLLGRTGFHSALILPPVRRVQISTTALNPP